MKHKKGSNEEIEKLTRYADMLSAMGNEVRLQIIRLLIQAHPQGLVAGEIQNLTSIPPSTLSHHLEKLRMESILECSRESTFLRYKVNHEGLRELLDYLYQECCSVTPSKSSGSVCCTTDKNKPNNKRKT